MADRVIGVRGDILILDFEGVFSICSLSKLTLINSNRRLARIVDGVCRMLIRRRGARRGHRVGEIFLHEVINLSADINPPALTIYVIIINGELIGVDIIEHGHGVEGFRDGIANFNRIVIRLIFPVIKHLALDERIIRQCRDRIARGEVDEILGLRSNDIPLVVLDEEPHGHLFLEVGIQGEILVYRGGGRVLRALAARLGEPAAESHAVLDGIGRQHNGGARGSRHFFVLRIVHHECNGKDILLVGGFNGCISGDPGSNREFRLRSLKHPLSNFIGLLRYCRIIVIAYGKRAINIDINCLKSCAVFIEEGHGVGDLLALIHDGGERIGYHGFRGDLCGSSLHDPPGGVARHLGDRGKLVADGRAFRHLDRGQYGIAAVICLRIERDGDHLRGFARPHQDVRNIVDRLVHVQCFIGEGIHHFGVLGHLKIGLFERKTKLRLFIDRNGLIRRGSIVPDRRHMQICITGIEALYTRDFRLILSGSGIVQNALIGRDGLDGLLLRHGRQYVRGHEVHQHQQREYPCQYALLRHLDCSSLWSGNDLQCGCCCR